MIPLLQDKKIGGWRGKKTIEETRGKEVDISRL
jgi:hypothetical protein